MSIDPKDLWAALPPALRRQIVDDVAAVLAEISREVRTGEASPPGAQGRCHAAAWNETAIPSQINGIDVAANLRKCCLERELASFAAVELRISGLHVAATLAEAMVGRGYRDRLEGGFGRREFSFIAA